MTGKPFSLSVKGVLFDPQGRFLLLRRAAASRHFAGQWEWPGGKVDPGEDFATAIVRETREETALEVEISKLAGATQFEMPAVNVVQLCMEARVIAGEVKLSEEHDAFAWVPLAELRHYDLPEPHRDFMQAYAQRKGTQP